MRVEASNGIWIALVVVLMGSTTLQSQALLIPPIKEDPFVGEWKANREKSRPKPGKREATYTRTIVRDGTDWIFSSRIENVKASEHNYRIHFDGQFQPAPHGLLVSHRYTAPNVIEGETMQPDGKIDYWRQEVSLDGQELKITGFKDRDRTKIKSFTVLDRVK
jgi:hypothetical protein